jgi:hypothetical protein
MPSPRNHLLANQNSQMAGTSSQSKMEESLMGINKTNDVNLPTHSIHQDRGTAIVDASAGFDQSFVAGVEEARREQLPLALLRVIRL